MEFKLHTTAIGDLSSPLCAVPVFADDGAPGEAFEAVDRALAGLPARLVAEEAFKADAGKSLLCYGAEGSALRRVLLVGLGKAADLKAAGLRGLASAAVQEANRRNLPAASCVVPPTLDAASAVRFAVEGVALGAYRYDKWRSKDVEVPTCEAFTFVTAADAALEGIVARTRAACDGVNLARDLVNGPPVEVTPPYLADVAAAIAKEHGLEAKIFDKAAIAAHGMNLLLAVNAGSEIEPRFIHLTYRPEGATAETPQIAFVGKGLTFDAGGYNIKPTGSMEDMKMDMAGGAAVLGAMKAVAAFRPGYVVHGIVPSTENLVSGKAYKPGDIYRGMNGKSVEIMNTDAEGRLILADALCYAAELGVARIVDLATLTGACVVALGPHTAGIFSNNDAFAAKVKAAGDSAGEDLWQMPMVPKLKGQLKSPVADMKNVGERWGGAITAAQFLEEFVGDTTWVHLDIAGPAYADKAEGHIPKGGTGFAVLTLLELLTGEV